MQESGLKNQEAGSLKFSIEAFEASVLTKQVCFEETLLLSIFSTGSQFAFGLPNLEEKHSGTERKLDLPENRVSDSAKCTSLSTYPALDPQLAIGQHLETQQINLNYSVEVPDHNYK